MDESQNEAMGKWEWKVGERREQGRERGGGGDRIETGMGI